MSKFKVVIVDFGVPDKLVEAAEFEASGLDVELLKTSARTEEEIIPHVGDVDGIMVGFAPISREVIEAMDRCRVISRYGIGYNNVDLDAATERAIVVCNVPDYCLEEVSTHTIGLMLCLNRHIHLQDKHIRLGAWRIPDETAPGRLTNQVLGIVGLGNIGRLVAEKALALGVKVRVYDPYLSPETASELGIESISLDELLMSSDYVSLHCPLNEETYHLIGAEQLERMRPTAYLINMARGSVVDQEALTYALQNNLIAGAGLDVFEEEPLPAGDPLTELDNVILTSHSSSWSEESGIQLRSSTAKHVIMVLTGEIPKSVVNPSVLG